MWLYTLWPLLPWALPDWLSCDSVAVVHASIWPRDPCHPDIEVQNFDIEVQLWYNEYTFDVEGLNFDIEGQNELQYQSVSNFDIEVLRYRGSILEVTDIEVTEVTKLRYRWSTSMYSISKFTTCTQYRIRYRTRYCMLLAKTNGNHCTLCTGRHLSAPQSLSSLCLSLLAHFHCLLHR